MTSQTTATPAKLRSGAWGARVKGDVAEGDQITICAKSGKQWDAEVTRVVWSNGEVSICATASIDRRRGHERVTRQAAVATRRSGGRACSECGGHVQPWSDGAPDLCHDCF